MSSMRCRCYVLLSVVTCFLPFFLLPFPAPCWRRAVTCKRRPARSTGTTVCTLPSSALPQESRFCRPPLRPLHFDGTGYVQNTEKSNIDADKLLQSMQKATEGENVTRKERGWAAPNHSRCSLGSGRPLLSLWARCSSTLSVPHVSSTTSPNSSSTSKQPGSPKP